MAAKEIKRIAEKEVAVYLAGDDFRELLDSYKRRQRERVLAEVNAEIDAERSALLAEGKLKLQLEVAAMLDSESILLHNKLRMERQQRAEFEESQRQSERRLQEVQRRSQLELEVLYVIPVPN